MPVECIVTNLESDVRCAVCGQGFLLFASRPLHLHRDRLRSAVQQALRTHHSAGEHPAQRFSVLLPAGFADALQS